MRLATFRTGTGEESTIGAFVNGYYVDLHALSNGELPDDMRALLEMGADGLARAEAILAELGDDVAGKTHVHAADSVVLGAPVPRPGKIIHTACNFDSHLEELTDWQEPEWQSHNWGDFHFEHPTGFLEAPSSVTASGSSVAIPHFTKQLDFEIEIGIVIGKKAFRVSPADAMDYVAGYTIFNDLSARDIQAREHSNKVILLGKSFNGSCPFGPHLVTTDELSDPHNLDMKLRVNDEVRQDANTGDMHYKTAELVSWWSNTTLEPGDIITSGSPPGVAAGMKAPVWLKAGDRIDATVAELGTLTTHIVADV
jgi:2-keto-4-pentenoate hydratase/2-oxohepta-3-ene-1,7-dioic acid hydratase in catechol pathway